MSKDTLENAVAEGIVTKEKNGDGITVNRNYKDTIFRMLFREKKELLSLYNAVNHSHYTNPEELEIVTLENAVYMNMKNDLAFLMDFRLHLYEHQSSYNPNMPLRDLFYVAKEYQKLVDISELYSSVAVTIPAPRFLMFYNGISEKPEKLVMKLSELYRQEEECPQLELIVTMININAGYNTEIMKECEILRQYAVYVDRVRRYREQKGLRLQDAVECAVRECIREGILADFLRKNKEEAISVSIFEYNEAEVKEKMRRAEREAGKADGMALIGQLILALDKDGRGSEISKVAEDAAYRDKLLKEYGLAVEK